MGARMIGTALMAGAALLAQPALAQAPAPDAKFTKTSQPVPPTATTAAEQVPDLVPGEDLAIACEAIERVADPSDVRVVLTIAAMPGDTSPGYKKILAINEKVTGSAVHLKVPNAPDLANHTIDLAVYVADGTKNNDCDGGKYRIVETKTPASTT